MSISILRKRSIGERLFITLMVISIIPLVALIFDMPKLILIKVIFFMPYYLYVFFLFFIKKEKNLEKSLFFLGLLLWTIIILARSMEPNYAYVKKLIESPYIFLPYTFPFVARYFSIADIKKFYLLIHFTNIIYLCLFVLYATMPNMKFDPSFTETSSHDLAFPNFLLLLSFPKLTTKQKVVSIVVFFVGLFLSIICARRGLIWMFAWAGALSIFINLNTKNSALKKISIFTLAAILALLFYFLFINYEQQIFGLLLNRIDEDSRGGILDDFHKDMDIFDYTFGRGIGGTYSSRMTDVDGDWIKSGQRNIIEAGYLTIVLEGGYIYLILLLIIYLKAMYNGFLKSNNLIAKAFALFILLHILELYPAGVLWFNMRFLLIWICIAMCYNKTFLNCTDDDILPIKKYKPKIP
jgi:hypothetical protein